MSLLIWFNKIFNQQPATTCLPTGFHSLPDEVLQHILAYITSQETLRNLVSCSRHLYRVFFPYLYMHIQIWDAPSSQNLRRFALALFSDNQIGSCVQSFTLRETLMTRHTLEELHQDFSEKQVADSRAITAQYAKLKITKRLRREHGLGRRSSAAKFSALCRGAIDNHDNKKVRELHGLFEDIDEGNEVALIGLLLTLTPNLRSLDISLPGPVHEYEQLFALSRSTTTYSGCLTNVMYSLHGSDQGNAIITRSIYDHFNVSSLRTLKVRNLANIQSGTPLATQSPVMTKSLVPSSSNVTYLEFRAYSIPPDDIAHLVKACRGLRTFIFEHPKVVLPPDTINRIISPTKLSLETLWLRFGPLKHLGSSVAKPMLSLADFTCLQRLRVQARLIFSTTPAADSESSIADLIPASLIKLQVLDCSDSGYLQRMLRELATWQQNATSCSNLHDFTIDGAILEGRPRQEMMEVVRLVRDIKEKTDININLRDSGLEPTHIRKGWGWDEEGDWLHNADSKKLDEIFSSDLERRISSDYTAYRAIHPEVTRTERWLHLEERLPKTDVTVELPPGLLDARFQAIGEF